MKYIIYDRVNKEFLSGNYCINQDGNVMTIKGLVFENQEDFQVIAECENMGIKNENGEYLCKNNSKGWKFSSMISFAYCFDNLKELKFAIEELGLKDFKIV
jgi:hypothetical protein